MTHGTKIDEAGVDWTKISEQGVTASVIAFFLWFVLKPLVQGHLKHLEYLNATQAAIVAELKRIRRPRPRKKEKSDADAVR